MRRILALELADGRRFEANRYWPEQRTVGHWEAHGITVEQTAPWMQTSRIFYPWANVRAVEWHPEPTSP